MKPPVVFIGIVALCLAVCILVLYALYNKGDRYIPKIKILASTDGGASYTEYRAGIPIAVDVFFIKYEVVIKTNGLWYMVLGNEIPFTITYQASFQIPCPPADTDIEYVCEFIGYANCRIAKEDTTVKKDSAGEDSQKEECSLSFFALATHRPQKAEITLRVTKQKNTQSTNARQNKAEFTLAFDKKVHPAYRKTIQLDFAGYAGKLLPQIQAVKPASAVMP